MSTVAAIRDALGPQSAVMKRGIVSDAATGRRYYTGYAYQTLYDWDQYFETIVQAYMGWPPDYAINGITIFLDNQREGGHIDRSVPSNQWHSLEHVKPFLSQTAVLIYRVYRTIDWLSNHYLWRLRAYLDYWLSEMDSTVNGLSEWMSAPHSGMDNQHERAGWWEDRICKGVDLNSYLVRECNAFAILCELTGHDDLVSSYRSQARRRAECVRELLWNEKVGFFFDMDRKTERLMNVMSVAGFVPLWADVATTDQATRMVHEHLLNEQEFWTRFPVPALARSERGYRAEPFPADLGCSWRANTWIPTNYIIVSGLARNGFPREARRLAAATAKLVLRGGDREYYRSEDGAGCGLEPFWGWSLLGHFIRHEVDKGIDMTALTSDPIVLK